MAVDLSFHHAGRKGKKFFSKNSTQNYTFANDKGELCVFYLKSIGSEF